MNRPVPRALLLLLLLSALFMTANVPLASSQGLTLVAVRVEGDLPTGDPDSDIWQSATALEVPLSAQKVAFPWLMNEGLRSITARALHNDSQLAILVEWQDASRNDQTIAADDFRDAVALQFPLMEGLPFFCMGQPGGNVNIWHWKADWQAELTERQDVDTTYPDMYVDHYPLAGDAGAATTVEDYQEASYLPALALGNLMALPARPSSVEDLVAGGYGTLTSQPLASQDVLGSAEWQGSAWRVIFTRSLTTGDGDDVQFAPGKVYSIAFAAWDGEQGERNGQKSTSQWLSFFLQAGARQDRVTALEPKPRMDIWAVLLLGLVALITVFFARLIKDNAG